MDGAIRPESPLGAKKGARGRKKRGENRDRRGAVLSAARRIFFEKGYRGTTIEEIARHAGYSKRTVYLDFLNKDDVFLAVCAEGMELLLERMRQIPSDGFSPEEYLGRLLEVIAAFGREHNKYLRMFCLEATPDVVGRSSPQMQEYVGELEKAGFRMVVEQIQKAISLGIMPPTDPWQAAGILLGAVTGVILLSLAGSQTVFSTETLDSMGKTAGLLVWKGWCSR